jgi:hypothetical protein
MVERPTTEDLKATLATEVRRFCRQDHRIWKQPIVETLHELRETGLQSVFFGGTLRSLLISRLFRRRPGKPRDIDIVLKGVSVESLRDRFEPLITRGTRFGGFRLQRVNWQFDLWPLHRTWAFVNDAIENPGFAALPFTTFFNLEAIAVEVWPEPGRTRQIFSGDDQFFDGIRMRTLEINREDNPFPDLCVVRALVMAASVDFRLGPRLAAYIASHGEFMTGDQLETVQKKHYGTIRIEGTTLREWITRVTELQSRDNRARIALPIRRQLELWPETCRVPSIHVRCMQN